MGTSNYAIKKTSHILRVVTYQKRLPRQTVKSQSLQIFEIPQVPKQFHLLDLALRRTTRWPYEFPSNLHDLLILWNDLLLSGLVFWPPSLIPLQRCKMFAIKSSHISCVLRQTQSHRHSEGEFTVFLVMLRQSSETSLTSFCIMTSWISCFFTLRHFYAHASAQT